MTARKMDKPRVITNTDNVRLTEIITDLAEQTINRQILRPEDGPEFIDHANDENCHVIVIDYESLPGDLRNERLMTQFLRRVRKINGMKTILLNYSNGAMVGRWLDSSLLEQYMDDTKSTHPSKIIADIRSTYKAFLSERDPMTKLYNGATIRSMIEEEIGATYRSLDNGPVCVTMFDLDHFKGINDTYGHDAGDRALMAFTKVLKQYSRHRQGDSPARYGGEEFLLLSRRIGETDASDLAERIRTETEKLEVIDPTTEATMPITVSGGIAIFDGLEKEIDVDTLIKQADMRLYAAKEAGRNRVYGPKDYALPGQ